MRKSFTRAVAFLLSVVLCLGLFPVTTFADEGPTWPQYTNITLNENAKITCSVNSEKSRAITKIELTNYDAPVTGEPASNGDNTLLVGEITVYVDEALDKNFQYEIKPDALTATADVPTGFQPETTSFSQVTFLMGETEAVGQAFAFKNNGNTDPWDCYVYKFKVVVNEKVFD